jgi:WhiB family transcriptional regulator, redox-sensing transcriptional regulator
LMHWRDLAACLGMDTDLFFPLENIGGPREGRGISGEKERAESAKKVCGSCEVVTYCLDYALAFGEEHGIYGGTTPSERRSMGRKCA